MRQQTGIRAMAGPKSSMLGQIPLPRLIKTNYDSCSIQMRTLFGVQYEWDLVETGYTKP